MKDEPSLEAWERALEEQEPETSLAPHPLEAFFSEENLLSLIPFVLVISIVLGIVVQVIVAAGH